MNTESVLAHMSAGEPSQVITNREQLRDLVRDAIDQFE